jgi:hypothetical protein
MLTRSGVPCRVRKIGICICVCVLSLASACGIRTLPATRALNGTISQISAPVTPVDATTIQGKLLFGYQGWFSCPGDGSPLGVWEHWFRGRGPASAATLRVDMWPDVSELGADERCTTPLALPDGQPAQVFSAFNPATVDRHFRWLREYDLPGVFLQRFIVDLHNRSILTFRDAVARNVRSAAESQGRVFAIMYDVSNMPSATLVEAVKRDWMHLVDVLQIIDSPQYLRHNGRPLLAIWGLGFSDRPATAAQAAELIEFFKNNPDPRYRVTLLGGVPAGWRTLTRDAQQDPAWARVFRSFDIISPWTVGRFRDVHGVDQFYADLVAGDLAETRRLGIGYMPVLFPGFSWHNMNQAAPFNPIPRQGGRFYWRQVERALRGGSTMLYGAMFDEVDEGTAMFKTAASRLETPVEARFVTMDTDGEPLPSDWYLRLAREAQKRLAATAHTR